MPKKFVNVICIIYLNNILIFNEDSTNRQRYVQHILKYLKNFKFYVHLNKCEFNIEKMEFLTFIIFIKEIRMNSKQIQMMKE